MKKQVFIYGAIAGCIVTAWMLYNAVKCYGSGSYDGSMLLGYASMILAFAFIFVAVKKYRVQHNDVISFGKAFKIGILISLIASTIYVAAWLIYYYFFIPDFMNRYTAHQISELNQSHLPAKELAEKKEFINSMKQWYNSIFGVILLTYMEILPVGIIVSLITALILKRKQSDGSNLVVN
ncbi:DUF4199 domain-containing protein [Mucilaginibacter litoreus]|uniref:DUF4199 domain-containing protein n=1 Tax=Mucilaginibacter litoreus TaxID=1048221 RepID=A0ABW3ATI6_9SPHI